MLDELLFVLEVVVGSGIFEVEVEVDCLVESDSESVLNEAVAEGEEDGED